MFDDEKKTIFRQEVFIIILCVLISCVRAEAASPKQDIKRGNRHYRDGEYAASREKYSEALEKAPESDIVNFNLGTALYKEEDYEKAIDHLQKVFLSEDDQLKRNAHYNLGNALYQSGMMHAEDDIDLAISSLEKSLSQYKRVLSIEEGEKDAKHNYEYVQQELIRLKEKQKQQCDLPKDKEDQQQQEPQSQEEQKSQQQQQKEGQQEEQGQQEQKKSQGESGEKEQNQSGQEESSQEQQEKQDQGRGQEGEEDYNKQQEAGVQPQNAQELTQKEAQMLLESYQQAEEPQGLLKIYPKTNDTRPVFRDW